MKRICFLMDSLFSIGGVQRVTAVIASQLARDNDVTIMTFDKPEMQDTTLYCLGEAHLAYRFVSYPQLPKLKQTACRAFSGLYLKTSRPLRALSRPLADRLSRLYARSSFPSELRNALANELQQGRYDVIIGVHAPLAARLATMKPLLSPDTMLVGWIHNSFEALFGPTSPYIGPERQHYYICQLRRLDHTVVLSRHDADAYQKYDSRLRPTVIYNPLTLTPAPPSKGTSRQFLAVGRFSYRHKGFDLLIDAFSLFAQQNAEWTLCIVGEGPEQPLYEQKIADYGLADRISLQPFTRHIEQYYSQAQVYVLSSRWEGFGLVLVEAMAHGLPVVSSNLPTSLEIMGQAGIYFDNGNTEQLAQRLLEATQIDWPRKSAEAMAIATRFGVGAIAERWRQLIG